MNTIKRIPKEALLSNFSSNRTRGITGGRPTEHREDSRQHPNGGRQMRILVLLCIQKGSKERPPNRRFYCCCASRKHPRRGHQIADSSAVGHPDGAQTEAPRSQILFVLSIQKGRI